MQLLMQVLICSYCCCCVTALAQALARIAGADCPSKHCGDINCSISHAKSNASAACVMHTKTSNLLHTSVTH
jgi:hypothetical protein